MGWARLAAATMLGLLILWRATTEPPPAPATASPVVFSSGRAMADIRRIAAEPHPVGSPANGRVRDYLLQRLAALGLSPAVRTDLSAAPQDGGVFIPIAKVENIVAVLPGRDRTTPALALMAHYDSAPGSPGAGDDAAGVAAVLETVRALQTRGAPERDVLVVLTDGEEPGLLGAEAFFSRDPLARRIGVVLNLEARGGGGRALMFETSAGDGGLIRALQRSAVGPATNSLAAFVYRRMPNGTDLTPAMQAGKAGLNFAFLGRAFDYHAPTATPDNLNEGSVQSLGEQALALAADLAFAPALPLSSDDLVFADLFGVWLVTYPVWAGWLVLAGAAALIAIAWRRGGETVRIGGLVRGAVGGLAAGALAAGALWLTREWAGAGPGYLAERAFTARFVHWEAAMALACAGAAVLAATLSGRRGETAGPWLGLLLAALALAVGLQIWLPLAAHVVAWPLLIAAAAAVASRLGADRRWPASLALIVAGALSIGWVGGLFHLMALGIGASPVLGVFAWLASFSVWPLLQPRKGRAAGWAVAGALLVVAAGLIAVIRLTSPWSERRPQPTIAYYVADFSEGRFWRAVVSVGPSAWAEGVLRADGGAPVRRPLPPLRQSARMAPARPVAVVPPAFALGRTEGGAVALDIPGVADAQEVRVQVRSSAPATDTRINGRPTPALPTPGAWTTLAVQPRAGPLRLAFRPSGPGEVEARYAVVLNAWPAGAEPLPARPPAAAPWGATDALVLTGRLALTVPPSTPR